MCEKQVYSYHTFLYPFLLENRDNGYSALCERLNGVDSQWERADLIEDGALAAVTDTGSLLEARLDYQAFQYFNPSARKALFDRDGGICSSYRLKNAKDGSYTVIYEGKSYPLNIDAVRLKAFNTGVAVISFELEYYMPEGGVEQARKDIRIINEFGRRLYPEFLLENDTHTEKQEDGTDKEVKNFLLCADSISIALAGKAPVTLPLRSESILSNGMDNTYLKDPVHLPNLITELTGLKESDIEPAIDDRMFVCCCILDAGYADHFLGYPAFPDKYNKWGDEKRQLWDSTHRQSHNWAFQSNWKIGCELYALTNIDAGDSSCQNRLMLDEYFDQQLYLRWVEYGTIHAVTNHSMMCLTSPYVMDSVVNPFLVEYVPMCILGLAQRASLLSFDTQITETIKNAQGAKKPLSGEMLDDLISLTEDFAIFQGQLLLQEITPQIQGIELYKKLQNMLFIPHLEKNIQGQLNNLYQIAEANRDRQDAEERQRRADQEKAREQQRQKEREEKERREKEEAELQEANSKRIENFFMLLAILGIVSACVDLTDYVEKLCNLPDGAPEFIFALSSGGVVALVVIIVLLISFIKKPRKKG